MLTQERIKGLLVFIVIGILVGLATFRLAEQGKITKQIEETEKRTVVEEENAITVAVEKASPSVVAIGVTQRIINPFDPFSLPRSRQSTIGTGFVVSEKGIIVTNRHVVSDLGTKYSVVTRDGKKLEVIKIYRDPSFDLALVKVAGPSADGLKALELGDSSKLKVGQTVIAIGNALGRFSNTVTTGVVSGLGRAVTAGDPFSGVTERLDDLIQTDAAINPGNSGGPLLNSSGQVIGVNVATTEGAQNIGFAIPINSVKALVEEFERTGTVAKPFLGIRYIPINREAAIRNNLPQGAFIDEVVEGSPAQKAGIASEDIITKIDGKGVNEENTIAEVIKNKKVGDSLSLEVWRDGQTRTVTAKLEESPNQ